MDSGVLKMENFLDIAFTEKSVRRSFIRKVYAILTVQLLITFGIISIFVFIDAVQKVVNENPLIYLIPLSISIVLIIILACGHNFRRKTPYNFIALFLFTLCEGITIGCMCATFEAKEVSVAFVALIAVIGGLTLFSFQTKIDFTVMSGLLFALIMVLLTFGIFALIFQDDVLTIIYYSLGALMFSFYIVIDSQLILGGKHQISTSPEEYIFAALNLYFDIIYLFILFLALIVKEN